MVGSNIVWINPYPIHDQSNGDTDKRIFNPDGTLRPGWRVVIEGVPTKRGWEYVYIHSIYSFERQSAHA
jgi:hypothetical protein